VFKFHDGAPLHDPCAVAAVIAPCIFKVGGGWGGQLLVNGQQLYA
jgi:hypothetical protein